MNEIMSQFLTSEVQTVLFALLGIVLKQRELMKFGDCANCGYPVEADYVLCPNCHTRLKNLCPTCHHALDPAWTVCPYCTTKIK